MSVSATVPYQRPAAVAGCQLPVVSGDTGNWQLATGNSPLGDHVAQHLREADRDSVGEAAITATAVGTAFRTTMPILASDVVALVTAGMAGQWVVRLFSPTLAAGLGGAGWAMLLPLVLAYWLSDLYSELWAHPVVELRQLARITTVGVLAEMAVGLLVPAVPWWCLAAWPGAVVLVPLMRTVVRHCCARRRWWGYPAVVIGSGEQLALSARLLLDVPRSGLRPKLLHDPSGECRSAVLPLVNDAATLASLVRWRGIRHGVICPGRSAAELDDVLDRYGKLVPHLLVLSEASGLAVVFGASRQFGRLSGIEVRNGLLLATLQAAKRAIDVTVALAALTLGLPLLLVVAAMVKLTSRGPIFFSHRRIGRRGRPIRVWKFRTMLRNGDEILAAHLAAHPEQRREWDRDHKLRDDPRVTLVGGWLRRLSIDELPQLWNVLRGDMSLVGPRPIVEAEVPRYGSIFRKYASVKPGLTGLWQVSGRNDMDYRGRVLLDEFYVRHWSPWLDIYVLAKTVVVLLRRHGAY